MRSADRFHSPTPEEVMEYLDGEGSAASRAAIEAHLASCAACQHLVAEQQRLSSDVHAWTVPPAPGSLQPPAPAVRARSWRPSRVMLAGLSAAAVVLIMVAVNVRGRSALRTAPAAKAMIAALEDSASKTRAAAMPPPASAPTSVSGAGGGRVGQRAQVDRLQANLPAEAATAQGALHVPSVVRTAVLHIVARDFPAARTAVEAIVAGASGFLDHLTVTGDTSTARTITGTLRVPSDRMADTLTRLRGLGQVVQDTQGSQDVTDQIVDLDARLASARATEQRLIELLRNRTGRLSDVLEVERELTRVRLDIERLVAEKTNVSRRVTYATIQIEVREERKATIDGPVSFATRIRVAAADGLEAALDSLAGIVLLILRAGPVLALWGGVIAATWILLRRRLRFGIRD
jgi:hypothetical protein